MSEESEDNITCTVTSVREDGPKGPFAYAEPNDALDDIESITFSLQKNVWKEKRYPGKGEVVILCDITKTQAGWRASKARFFRLKDR